jgi:DNA-binding MarR family transcriptional regulator
MPTKSNELREELQQTRPFHSPAHEAVVSILRTAAVLHRHIAQVVEPGGVTAQQYNVLRILRGAGEAGLTAGDVGERMVTRDPDVTRLLDRLETRGLAERSRCTEDRRVVWTRITAAGVAAIAPLDEPVNDLHLRSLGHLGAERLGTLIELLEAARGAGARG